jgi:hypothetical protein
MTLLVIDVKPEDFVKEKPGVAGEDDGSGY